MKKIIAVLLCLLMVSVPMAAYAEETPAEQPEREYEEVTLRMASGAGSTTMPAVWMSMFCDMVHERSGGKITIEWYPDSQLYGTSELPEAVLSGAIDIMHNGTAGTWPDYIPVFNLTETWFMWSSREHVHKHIEDYRALLFPLWEEIGVHPLFFVDQGEGGFISKVPIQGPEDISGLIMCGPNEPDWRAIEALGGTAVQISSGERYDALSKGAVDAMRLIYTGITRFSLQDFCPYFVPHCSMSLFGVVMNMDTWESLSKDAQDLITECGLEMEEYSFENMPAYEQENLDILSEACEVYELTPDDIAAFQTALEPYYETIIKDCEEKGYLDQANKFLEIAKAVD